MKTKDIKGRVREYFFVNPTKRLRVRQIERIVKVPLPSAIRYAKELEHEGILKSSLISGIKFYAADRSSEKFLLEKKLFNLKELFDCGLIDYLKSEFSNPTLIVFGSYSKGEDTEQSDIDMYIETPKKQKVEIEKFESILKRKIQIFNYSGIEKVPNKELSNNIINGVTLNGFLEVFK